MTEEAFDRKHSPISPPTLLMKSTNSATNYSLFNTNKTSFDFSLWDWKTTPRKHSIQAYKSEFSLPALDSWRSTSTSNIRSIACTFCHDKYSRLYTPSCGQHYFCHFCSVMLSQGQCLFCTQTSATNVNEDISLFDTCTSMFSSKKHTTSACLSSVHHTTVTAFNANTLRNFPIPSPAHYPCIKLSNIPWDISQNDVRYFFGNCRSPSPSTCIQSIHIMMNRTTGKTLSDAYVEFASISDVRRAIDTRNQKPLKGRIVSVTECTQEELLTIVFPKWRGQFQGICAIPPTTEVVRSMSTAAGGGNSGCPPFVTREEINSLLVVCKNYKLHFSRKCAERPFENIISIIAKYPWHQSYLISIIQRDHIYEMLKLSIEALKTHLAKDYVQIDSTLLERLTRAGIMCSAFTERQKMTLLQTASIECPKDIAHLLSTQNATTDTIPPFTINNNSSTISTSTISSISSKHFEHNSDTASSSPFSYSVSAISSPPPGFGSDNSCSQILFATTNSIHTPVDYTSDVTSSQISSTATTTPSPLSQQSSLDVNRFLSDSSLLLSFFRGGRTTSRMKFVKEDDALSEDSPLISSLIRDIQKQCSLDNDVDIPLQKSLPSTKSRWNNTFPLLLQPLSYSPGIPLDDDQTSEHSTIQTKSTEEQSSPWASSCDNNIWKMTMPVESNTSASSKSLLAT
ncbi:MAG: hypothetical protein EXX96DRAFT_291119 [Benjaminiella poitrasii]|nr:MAG: hypothetical protein EXX96DRAFT_291119 [Benjaminiella poitrasii]